MRKFKQCPDCGCTVDENLIGHHSATDCSILKYAERHDDAIRRECADQMLEFAKRWRSDAFAEAAKIVRSLGLTQTVNKEFAAQSIERSVIIATEPAREES